MKKQEDKIDSFETSSEELKEESSTSSDSSNEFWNVEPQLQARTLLSKGRIMYKKGEQSQQQKGKP